MWPLTKFSFNISDIYVLKVQGDRVPCKLNIWKGNVWPHVHVLFVFTSPTTFDEEWWSHSGRITAAVQRVGLVQMLLVLYAQQRRPLVWTRCSTVPHSWYLNLSSTNPQQQNQDFTSSIKMDANPFSFKKKVQNNLWLGILFQLANLSSEFISISMIDFFFFKAMQLMEQQRERLCCKVVPNNWRGGKKDEKKNRLWRWLAWISIGEWRAMTEGEESLWYATVNVSEDVYIQSDQTLQKRRKTLGKKKLCVLDFYVLQLVPIYSLLVIAGTPKKK